MTVDLSLVVADVKGKRHNSFPVLEDKSVNPEPIFNENKLWDEEGEQNILDEKDSSFHQQTYEGSNGIECCKQKECKTGRSLGTSARKSKHG